MANIFCHFLRLSFLFHFVGTMSVSKRELFLIWYNEAVPSKKFLAVENHIFSNIIDKNNHNEEQCREMGRKLRIFIVKLVEKWKDCNRRLPYFEKRNKEWLEGDLELIAPTTSAQVGRPVKEFSACSVKSQVHKVSSLINESSCSELIAATRSSLYRTGKRTASKVISMLDSNDVVAAKIKKVLNLRAYYLLNILQKRPWLFILMEVIRNTRTN